MKPLAALAFSAVALTSSSVNQPSPFELLVSKHVDAILQEGYAESIQASDLNHGHLIINKHKGCYGNLGELISNTRMVLYHSDEGGKRWQKETRPNKDRVQRSIVGFPDGSIKPAIKVLKDEYNTNKDYYECCGTIIPWDLSAAYSLHDTITACVSSQYIGLYFYFDKYKNLRFGEEIEKDAKPNRNL
jgi:hypothetical protein